MFYFFTRLFSFFTRLFFLYSLVFFFTRPPEAPLRRQMSVFLRFYKGLG